LIAYIFAISTANCIARDADTDGATYFANDILYY